MERLKKFGLFFSFIFFAIHALSYQVEQYQTIFQPGFDQQQRLKIAIRSFQQGKQKFYLVVDAKTLMTEVIKQQQLVIKKNIDINSSHYVQVLNQLAEPPFPLQNDGLTHALKPVLGTFLTVDLCPTRKGIFEKSFFERLAQRRIPVAISVGGAWITEHPKEFLWLLKQKNKTQIIWVNHAFHHFYSPGKALNETFLLTPGINLSDEILTVEKLLLRYDQVPSVFFRFPGLVSSEALIQQIKAFGLIPLGADAWLAKNEKPQKGSIILVHGNGNEAIGIKKFNDLLAKENVSFLPLLDAVKD